MEIKTIQTGSTLVSSAVPDRSTHKSGFAYTGLFQKRSKRIEVPVKCFYITVGDHHVLVDAGWSKAVTKHPIRHLGAGLWFASEPVMKESEAAVHQLSGDPVDGIYMTHLDCDHVSGLRDFTGIPIYASREEVTYASRKHIRYGKLTGGYEYQYLTFSRDPKAPFKKSADIFGDGSFVAYLTPTHSAGSVIYKVQENGKFALIVGDNGYNEASWNQLLLPGPIFSRRNMKKSLQWIRDQSREDGCIGIFCAHDPIDREHSTK